MFAAWLADNASWLLLLYLVAAVAALSVSADRLVDAMVAIARHLGVSPLLIGATLVSLGTTAPEVAVSVMAAFTGEGSLALGNGLGSIIVDTGLIMGLVLLLGSHPFRTDDLTHANLWREGASLLLALLLLVSFVLWPKTGTFPRLFGLILLAGLSAYLFSNVKHASRRAREGAPAPQRLLPTVFILLWSLPLLLLASRLLVDSAVVLAHRWHVPASVIAVSMVAFGTSVPELSTAISALRKGHPELALGNVFGADVLNALMVVGASASMVPLSMDRSFLWLHLPAMLLLVLPFRLFAIWARRRPLVWRLHGLYLLLLYLFYLGILLSTPTFSELWI